VSVDITTLVQAEVRRPPASPPAASRVQRGLTQGLAGQVKRRGQAGAEEAELFGLIGRAMNAAAPPEAQRLALLNEIWKHVAPVKDIGTYMDVAVVFVEYVTKYFSDAELSLLLTDIVRHVVRDRAQGAVQAQLRACALKVHFVTNLHANNRKSTRLCLFTPVRAPANPPTTRHGHSRCGP